MEVVCGNDAHGEVACGMAALRGSEDGGPSCCCVQMKLC
jgi:hypothetical protein